MEENIALVALLTLFLNALAVFFAGFQSYQNRKVQFFQIAQDFRNRYAALVEERKELDHFYDDPDFDLQTLETEDNDRYKRLIHAEKKFHWYCFDQWYLGHIDKSAPRNLRKDWDYSIKESMQNPVHGQAWQKNIRKNDFRGHKQYNNFVDRFLRG